MIERKIITDVHRGEIYMADLNKVIGSEQGGIRPVLVLQNNRGNRNSPTIIVAPITTRKKRNLPVHVSLAAVPRMKPGSKVMLEQMRTIDKVRLIRYVATLDTKTMSNVEAAISISLEMRKKQNPPLEMCLCQKCASLFYEAPGTKIRRVDRMQYLKDECDFCGINYGYDYRIYRTM